MASGKTLSRAYPTQAITSATSAHWTIPSGYRSTAPLYTARAASYRGSDGVMIAPPTPARSSRASWLLVGLLVVVMPKSICRDGCGGLDETLDKPCGELTEELEVRFLDSLAAVDSQFIAQQDSQP